jgi:hypothetical protein
MNCGIVEVFKLGENYRFVRDDPNGGFEFIRLNNQGKITRDVYRYVVNARGQERSIETDPSALTRNLLEHGVVQIEEVPDVDRPLVWGRGLAGDLQPEPRTYKVGSIWIDPQTHQIMKTGSDGKTTRSNTIYAVGAMTRGQIIDTSMAHGLVRSTAIVAERWVHELTELYAGESAGLGPGFKH